MKKFLAALTAVTIAAGISLAAFVAPANADPTSTSTPTPTATSTPSSTPTPTPTSTPTSTPTPAPTSTTPAPVPTPTVALFTSNSKFNTDSIVVPTYYETIVWSMAPGFGGTSATYPQVGVAQFTDETTQTLDVNFTELCGVSYQVDVYLQSDASVDNTAALNTLYSTGLAGPDGAQDGSYLAGAGNNPGTWGLGNAWKFVTAAACQCLSTPVVTYTYSHDDTNSGDITVTNPNPAVYSNTLCKPFYVTAASWKYTGNATWPQVIDQVDKLGAITTASTTPYHYAAQVTCGQGDIYASYDSTVTSLNPGTPGYLVGPGNPINEQFLSGMGFTPTTWTGSTWIQDDTNCWQTPVPSDTVASCTAGGTNSLTLPPVPGGIWSYKVNGKTTTLASGAGLAGFTPTVFGQYTITLTQDTTQNVFTVTGGIWYWTPVDASNCYVVPVVPTSDPITLCDSTGGSINITPTAGVNYFIGSTQITDGTTWVDQAATTGLSGKVTVTAVAQQGYKFGKHQVTSWCFELGDEKDCTVTYNPGDCTAVNSVSTESVTIDVTNPSHKPATVVVTGSDISGSITFTVKPHHTVDEVVDTAGTTGDVYNVTVNGVAQPQYTLTFTGCAPVTPADPTFTDAVCAGNSFVGGSITVDGNADIVYTLNDSTGKNTYAGATFPSTAPYTITNLPADTYTVVATPINGYVLSTPSDFPYTVIITGGTDCEGTPLTPSLTVGQPTCAPDVNTQSGQLDATAGKFQTDDTEVEGTLTLGQVSQVTWTINGVGETSGSAISEPDNTYTVVATLTPTAVSEGYTFAASTGSPAYTLSNNGTEATFDAVVFACHADQALALLSEPTAAQDAILGAIRCQDNTAILHTDIALMPRRRAVWSAWNYMTQDAADRTRGVSVTYWMNRLQGMVTPEPLLVSLNPLRAPDPARVLSTRVYRHPQFDAAAVAAQERLPTIQGKGRMWFAGAWTGWGFHEDGIASAVRVARDFGAAPPWEAQADRAAQSSAVAA